MKIKGNRRRGTILNEILIVLAVISFVLFFIYNRYEKLNEKMELERAADIFETVVYKYTAKSLAVKKSFYIKFDYQKKKVSVRDITRDKIIEEIELPKKLKYGTVYNGIILKNIDFTTKEWGNLSKAFSVYICDYSENAKYRVAYYNFQQSRLLKINVYKNTSAGDIKYKDLEKYHYGTDENEGKVGWIRE